MLFFVSLTFLFLKFFGRWIRLLNCVTSWHLQNFWMVRRVMKFCSFASPSIQDYRATFALKACWNLRAVLLFPKTPICVPHGWQGCTFCLQCHPDDIVVFLTQWFLPWNIDKQGAVESSWSPSREDTSSLPEVRSWTDCLLSVSTQLYRHILSAWGLLITLFSSAQP
jgi:hypothetical protein